MDEKYYNPQAIYSPQNMQDYENQMRLENSYVQRYKDDFGVNNDMGYNMPYNYTQQYQPTIDDYVNQMERENSAAWQYSGGRGQNEPLMPNVRQGGNLLYNLLSSYFSGGGDNLSQLGREQSIRNTLARDGIY